LSRADLLEDVWGYDWIGPTDTVTVHVRRLRSKIEVDPSNPRHLVTVHGVGYRFDP
jgi:two-component system response regulator RegX3